MRTTSTEEYSHINLTTPIRRPGGPGRLLRQSRGSSSTDRTPIRPVEAVGAALDVARSRWRAPPCLEMKTYRYAGHSRADKAGVPSRGEFERWYERDPINTFRARLESEGLLTAEGVDEIDERVAARLEAAIQTVDDSPPATVDAMFRHIYAPV